jgi:putative transposase
MDNHVHLLLGADGVGCVSSAMAVCSHRYVRYFNYRHARTGTLFQSRFKSCLVDSETYLMRVMRYIELNPVRAGLAETPQDYPWSSARGHLGLRRDRLLSIHPAYEQLAATPDERVAAYRAWLMQPVDAEEQASIRRYMSQERALGSERFHAMVEKALNQPATVMDSGHKRRAVPDRL